MPMNRSQWLLVSGMLVLFLSPIANAQTSLPFADSEISPDFQWFAPAEYEQYSGDPVDANTGWFATYDRLYLNVSRDNTAYAPWDSDRGWGNRFDLGYMSEEDHGWLFTIWHITGPGQMMRNPNRLFDTADGADNGIHPSSVGNSTNIIRYSGFEANKTWRLEPLFHRKAVLEPFIGVRWIQFEDEWQREAITDVIPTIRSRFTDRRGTFNNKMLGGQAGFRYSCRYNAWILSTEVRAFALQNWQLRKENTESELFFDDPDPAIDAIRIYSNGASAFMGKKFVGGGELRVEAAYHVTRNVYLRVGLEAIYMDGIGRDLDFKQELSMIGTSFGVVLNR